MPNVIETVQKLHKQFPNKLPPVHLWNPPLSGDMDMRIAADGKWFHEGEEIRRHSLVKLFSSILKKESAEFFLVTPVEKWRIQVDNSPFLIVACEVLDESNFESKNRAKKNEIEKTSEFVIKKEHAKKIGSKNQLLCLTTNTDDKVIVDENFPIWVETKKGDAGDEVLPYVIVRDNLVGLINRNVYYQLIDMALESAESDSLSDDVSVWSAGKKFSLYPKAK